ncbi:receptor-like protein 9a [Wolffia australiana]
MEWWRSRGHLLQLLAVAICCCTAAKGCQEKERSAVLRLREELYKPGKVNSSEWPSWVGTDCCQWDGISCGQDSPRRVIGVSLSNRRTRKEGWIVDGSIFPALEKLQLLELSGNQIIGWSQAEGMTSLRDLRRVNLGENKMSNDGVSWISRLPLLAEVDLSYNEISSFSAVKGLCGSKTLTAMRLNANKIAGIIDPCIVAMPKLEELNLGNNLLSGEIPSFSKVTSIKLILLSGNRLSGTFFFSSLAALRNLTGVSLSFNPDLEVETERPAWTPSFQLAGLDMAGCVVNRRSGYVLPSFLSSQKNLEVLDLRRTSIKGNLPSWIFDNVGGTLLLGGNRLTGRFPRLSAGPERRVSLIDLSENSISGPLPDNMRSLLPNLYQLNISRNAIKGNLDSFAQPSYLGVLDASYNEIEGEIPAGLAANGSRISHLNLGNNKLRGSMLPRGSSMMNLRYLILENNLFTGGISTDLSNSPGLIILNIRRNQLTGPLPTQFFNLPELAVVLLGGNKLHGGIPSSFCSMKGLRILDLSGNFFSGYVPKCLNEVPSWRIASKALLDRSFYFLERVAIEFRTKGKLAVFEGDDLSSFTGVDLSRNQIGGVVPDQLGDLAALKSLNISHNQIGGVVPASFQGLGSIESLDLSHNKITGKIPPQMARLRQLTVFCIAFNKIVGDIPPQSRVASVLGRGCF